MHVLSSRNVPLTENNVGIQKLGTLQRFGFLTFLTGKSERLQHFTPFFFHPMYRFYVRLYKIPFRFSSGISSVSL